MIKRVASFEVELMFGQELACGESPEWHGASHTLYWTDALGSAVYASRFGSGKIGIVQSSVPAAALCVQRDGNLLLAGRNGFYLVDHNGNGYLIRSRGEERPELLNEVIADPLGAVFAGQESYSDDTPDRRGFLFRMETDGTTQIVEEGLRLANGMGFSPDSSQFYLTDTIDRIVYRYDYQRHTGRLSNRSILIRFSQEDGLPDGLAVDSEGTLWVAMFLGSQVIAVDPDGMIKHRVPMPCAQPTSVAFAGRDLNEMVITSAALHWETSMAPSAHDFNSLRGGAVYKIISDVQGRPDFLSAIAPISAANKKLM